MKTSQLVIIAVLLVGVLFSVLIMRQDTNMSSQAASVNLIEAEDGVITGNVTIVDDVNASGGKYARFGAVPTSTPPPSPTPTPSGPELFVSTTGSDSNPGTQAAPFKTVQKGVNAAVAGTTIRVLPGVYNEKVLITKSGTANKWIKLVSETKHGARISTSATQTGYTLEVGGEYISIDGFELTGGRQAVDAYKGNFIFKNNKIHGVHKMAPTSDGGSAITVYSDGYAAISNVTVDSNIVYDIGQSVGGSQQVQGIYISVPCSGCKVTNNLVYNVEDFGIHAYHNPNGWIVANNTVFNNGRGILTGPNFVVVNNISMNNKSDNYDIRGTATMLKNLAFGTGGSWSTGVTVADPQFVNYQTNGSGDYHLKTTSPGYNGGTATSAPAADINGTPRPQGSGYDIGVYEQ